MGIANQSDLLKTSFRKYQWREALLWCLVNLTADFIPKDPVDIRREMDDLTLSTTGISPMEPLRLLALISDRNLIPISNKPHSVFFLSSEQNFLSACFDWLFWSVSNAQYIDVSPSYKYITVCWTPTRSKVQTKRRQENVYSHL